MAVTVDERLAQAFVKLADTLVAGYDLMEFLQTLTDRCVELLEVDAAGLLLDSSSGITGLSGYRPLDGLSDSRAEVYQATGMISVQLGVSLEEALVRLRAHAFAAGAPLDDIAADVVRRLLRFDPEAGPGR